MNNKEEQYKKIVEDVLNECEINLLDQDIENANLFFGISKHHTGNLNSKYISVINPFNVKELNEEEKAKMDNLQTIEDKKAFLIETLNKVTNKDCLRPDNVIIPKKAIVLEILVGLNTKKLDGQEFIDNMKQQKEFLKKLQIKYVKDLTRKLNLPIIIFYDKSI